MLQVGSQYNLYGQNAVYNNNKPQKQVSFGDRNLFNQNDLNTESALDTGIVMSLGIAAREALRMGVNKYLSGYLQQHKNIDTNEIFTTSKNLLKEKGLLGKIKINILDKGQDAYYNHLNNGITVTKNTLLSIPHEIGHAIQENNTTVLKYLQRFRGHYSILALALYALGRKKQENPYGEEKQSIFGKFQNFLHKYRLAIPLLAFAPELITEFAASKYGLDALKKHASPELLKVAKKHYIAAFCTYLALPLFAILDNLTVNNKSTEQSNGFG